MFSREPHALQIILYYDELELCNPLGTSAKIHKIGKFNLLLIGMHNYAASLAGVFYYQLGNLRPMYRSSLCSIHLVSIAKSSVIQKYGPDKILEPFIADVKELEKVELYY